MGRGKGRFGPFLLVPNSPIFPAMSMTKPGCEGTRCVAGIFSPGLCSSRSILQEWTVQAERGGVR